MRRPGPRAVASLQAAYYIPSALLPFISRRRFEALTGPKLEWWLVLTVASQVGVVGAVLSLAAARRPDIPEIRLLGAGTAGALGIIDVLYVGRRRISPAYLVDAVIEFSLVGAWLLRTTPSTSARPS